MTEQTNTVVIGAGQAGLASSYYLTQENTDHIVLEQASGLASAWHKRWDSFTLVTPNQMLQLPDFPYRKGKPGDFLTRQEVIKYLEDFAAMFDPPVRFDTHVTSVAPNPAGDGYRVHTDAGELEAENVVVAAGTFQTPRIPAFSQAIDETITQLHSSRYRNPESLPAGAILVVGAGQSGCQIAEELNQSGRQVYLCVSKAERFPRRYRGKDFMQWAVALGIVDRTVDKLDSPAERFKPNPRISGKDGGHTLNLHQFARDGIVLLGHMDGAEGSKVQLAPDLHENLAYADKSTAEFKQGVDKYIAKAGVDAPAPSDTDEPQDGYEAEMIRELDLNEAGITSIIWATGYTFDYSWIDLPIHDEYGYPVQTRGITDHPGLYFVGLHWLHTIKSGLFVGVGDDAAHVVDHLVHH